MRKRLLIWSPYAISEEGGRTQGNTVTALRLERIFRELGWEIEVQGGGVLLSDLVTEGLEVLVVLNAWRGAEVVRSFKRKHPEKKVIVVMTGTEMTRQRGSKDWERAQEAILAADVLVFSQEVSQALAEAVFDGVTERAAVIYPSVEIAAPSLMQGRGGA